MLSACEFSNRPRAIFKDIHTEFSPATIGSILWVGIVLCALLDFHRIVDDQVHELVEAADFALDAHAELLIEPDLYGAVLLQELEDEVDWR
jgi:predicted methyltransferase